MFIQSTNHIIITLQVLIKMYSANVFHNIISRETVNNSHYLYIYIYIYMCVCVCVCVCV
jgi:hypothetical protein